MSDEDVVILTDEEGTEVRFLHIMTFDFEDSFYVALTPEESVEGIETGEVLVLEIMEDEDGDDCYVPVEDDAKMDKVWAEFERLYYEDDEDEDDEDGEDGEDGGHSCGGCGGCGCDKETKQD